MIVLNIPGALAQIGKAAVPVADGGDMAAASAGFAAALGPEATLPPLVAGLPGIVALQPAPVTDGTPAPTFSGPQINAPEPQTELGAVIAVPTAPILADPPGPTLAANSPDDTVAPQADDPQPQPLADAVTLSPLPTPDPILAPPPVLPSPDRAEPRAPTVDTLTGALGAATATRPSPQSAVMATKDTPAAADNAPPPTATSADPVPPKPRADSLYSTPPVAEGQQTRAPAKVPARAADTSTVQPLPGPKVPGPAAPPSALASAPGTAAQTSLPSPSANAQPAAPNQPDLRWPATMEPRSADPAQPSPTSVPAGSASPTPTLQTAAPQTPAPVSDPRPVAPTLLAQPAAPATAVPAAPNPGIPSAPPIDTARANPTGRRPVDTPPPARSVPVPDGQPAAAVQTLVPRSPPPKDKVQPKASQPVAPLAQPPAATLPGQVPQTDAPLPVTDIRAAPPRTGHAPVDRPLTVPAAGPADRPAQPIRPVPPVVAPSTPTPAAASGRADAPILSNPAPLPRRDAIPVETRSGTGLDYSLTWHRTPSRAPVAPAPILTLPAAPKAPEPRDPARPQPVARAFVPEVAWHVRPAAIPQPDTAPLPKVEATQAPWIAAPERAVRPLADQPIAQPRPDKPPLGVAASVPETAPAQVPRDTGPEPVPQQAPPEPAAEVLRPLWPGLAAGVAASGRWTPPFHAQPAAPPPTTPPAVAVDHPPAANPAPVALAEPHLPPDLPRAAPDPVPVPVPAPAPATVLPASPAPTLAAPHRSARRPEDAPPSVGLAMATATGVGHLDRPLSPPQPGPAERPTRPARKDRDDLAVLPPVDQPASPPKPDAPTRADPTPWGLMPATTPPNAPPEPRTDTAANPAPAALAAPTSRPDPAPHGTDLATAVSAGPDGPRLPRHLPASLAKGASRAEEEGRLELMLDPVELGRVRFELSSTSTDRVQVNVVVERPETLDLLRRNVESLRAEFRDAGFDAATLSFSQWGTGGEAASGAPHRDPDLMGDLLADPIDDTQATLHPTPKNTSRHGLDLRL